MHEILAQIYGYVWGAWRFRWPGLALAWILALAGWAFVWTLPPGDFKATARLHVDSSSLLRPLLGGLAIQPNMEQRVEMMSRTLLSRPNLEKLIRMSDLDLNTKTEKDEEVMINSVKRSLRLSGSARNQSLYSISFQHKDRDVAKRVVQSLITIFIENALGDKRRDSSGAQAFIDQQIAEYELRLSEAEARRVDFRQRNMGRLPGEAGGYYKRLEAAKSELKSTQLQLSELKNRREELNKQAKGEKPMTFSGTFGNSQTLSPIDRRIQMFQEQLDRLSLNYTDLHPEMVQIRLKIEALEEEKRAAYEAVEGGDTSAASLGSNPVYQNIRSMLTETDGRIAELEVRVKEYSKRVKDLEDVVNNIPDIELELKQLDRDYSVIAGQHQALLKRRETALLSEKVEKNTDDVKFSVIDPPFVPLEPMQPPKLLYNSGILVISLLAGLALSLLITLIRPVYMDGRSLGNSLGLPVLGTITRIPSPEGARASIRKAIIFGASTGSLLLVFVGVNIVESML